MGLNIVPIALFLNTVVFCFAIPRYSVAIAIRSLCIVLIIVIIIFVHEYQLYMRSLIYIDTQVNGQLTNEQTISHKYEQYSE